MKQKKLNLKEISNALSRNEMKQIMAGSGTCQSTGICGGWSGIVCCNQYNIYCVGSSQYEVGQCTYVAP